MKNIKLRDYAKSKNVYLWEIAEKMNLQDSNFSRKLRSELSEEEQKKIILIIDEIEKEKA